MAESKIRDIRTVRIPLHTLTQAKLNTLTRAYPDAEKVLAYPRTAPFRHLFTLEFDTRQKRLIDAAAAECGVSRGRFMYNAISSLAEQVVGDRRATQIMGRRRPRPQSARRN